MSTSKKRHPKRFRDRPPLPLNAVTDDKEVAFTKQLLSKLPVSIDALKQQCLTLEPFNNFDVVRATANDGILGQLALFEDTSARYRQGLLSYAKAFMSPSESLAVCRMLMRTNPRSLESLCYELLRFKSPEEVLLPNGPEAPWDWTGLWYGIDRLPFSERTRTTKAMEVQETHNLPRLTTVKDLRTWLNISTPAFLGYLMLNVDAPKGPYTTFDIPKRSGQPRHIRAPNDALKRVQQKILTGILSKIPTHDAAHGFVPGRSTVTNARHHVGKHLVIKFDLKNFFQIITYRRVLGLFVSLGYTVSHGRFNTRDDSRSIAPVLTRLCTYTQHPQGAATDNTYTPQGAPTSPAISNLVCRRLDARLTGLAKSIDASYTRYADDLTFSMNKEPELGLGRLRWWVDQICGQEGFEINRDKHRVIRRHQRQQVTGLVVNDTLRIPRKERRRFRAILHNCRKHGIASQARGNPRFEAWLQGYASYIHMVHPEEGAWMLREVKALLGHQEASNP